MKFIAILIVSSVLAACGGGGDNTSATLTPPVTTPVVTPAPAFNMAQTISDGAQSTTMAFSGLALMTGNLAAQSFFPPGKVADYTGFQYLRDNDPDSMGHNTSFLTRVANNVIYILNADQLAQLSKLAATQQSQVDLYGYQRYPLMQAFRRLIEGNIPSGSAGLNLNAVKAASRALYLIDGQISFDRAMLYASVINSLDATQLAYLTAMKGKGWSSWPDITDAQISSKVSGLAQGSKVAVMTYASDIYSWYAGSLEADVYFCPERHGTYYGGFYIKDAPAVGHEGYSIDEQMTATAGAALIDTSKGYVTPGPGRDHVQPGGDAKRQTDFDCLDANANRHPAAQPAARFNFSRRRQDPGAGALRNLWRTRWRQQLRLCHDLRPGLPDPECRPDDTSGGPAQVHDVGQVRRRHGLRLLACEHTLSLLQCFDRCADRALYFRRCHQ